MISLLKKFLFIHVPKTGGNSIQSVLLPYSEDELTLRKSQDGLERFGLKNDVYATKKHSTLARYEAVLEPALYGSLFRFATIRNPWDLLISQYFSPHRGNTEWNRDGFIAVIKETRNLRHFFVRDPGHRALIQNWISS